jgi:predicted DNA-binding protein (MmcQ/YjbR family)
MALSAARVREIVAALADAQEGAHHGHPDFRMRSKIFATLSEREDRVALRITQVEAHALVERSPEVYRLVADREPLAWVSALLACADEPEITDLLEEAWQLRASETPVTRKRTKA